MNVVCRILAIAWMFAAVAPAAMGQGAKVEFFEQKIRPALAEHCYECHSPNSKRKKVRAELRLDTREGILRGGESGPIIVPGDPAKSLLMRAIRHETEILKMPPQVKLRAEVVGYFETWIKDGAVIPETNAAPTRIGKNWEETFRERRAWWSLQPVREMKPPMPNDAKWPANSIDQYVLAKLEAKGLRPAETAEPATLLRRLHLTATGLLPSHEETADFIRRWNGEAGESARRKIYEEAVDRVLASPHFGERWARHWMDVVRFSETHGNEWNYEVHHAWRYRDYLIRAFNADVPFDQLVREHIAGDLLASPRLNANEKINESIIGGAFYRFGEVNHDDCIDLRSIGYDLYDNQIDTFSKAFQGMTLACARCHDHKLDAISMKDYYGTLGVLRSSRFVAHTIDTPDVNRDAMMRMSDFKKRMKSELAAAWLRDADAMTMPEFKDANAAIDDPFWLWRSTPADAIDAAKWNELIAKQRQESESRDKHNSSFASLADFRKQDWQGWQADGHGLRSAPSAAGDFAIATNGPNAVASLFRAGGFTHALSERLNGALRSPVLTNAKKYVSMHVLGERASAVRLVSNNCQLNYRNFKYLTKSEWHWVTFAMPDGGQSLRPYLEAMTKFDNPKFPDQLGTLGGGKTDDRIPWEQAAADPRSYFGISHVVTHDGAEPPKEPLIDHATLVSDDAPATREDLARRYTKRLRNAVEAWRDGHANDDDVRWIEAFLKAGKLSNQPTEGTNLHALVHDYRKVEGELSMPKIVPGIADFGPGFDQSLFARGDCMRVGEPVSRRYMEAISVKPVETKGSGRRELAELIASRDNPLTARVFVNRVWHHTFGAGLVRTVDDLGHLGDLPSHPELLDDLAKGFMDDGWSLKRLLRKMLISKTFMQSHRPEEKALQVDPENRLLHHFKVRRMEAESIRDAMLVVSHRLDPKLFGPSIAAYRETDNAYRRLFRGPLDGAGRRSIYVKNTLMEAPQFLDAFNFPGGKVTQGRRDATDSPAQALAMLNHPFVMQQAEEWAKRLVARTSEDASARIDHMFLATLNRHATADERRLYEGLVRQLAADRSLDAGRILADRMLWRDVAHTLLNTQEFVAIP